VGGAEYFGVATGGSGRAGGTGADVLVVDTAGRTGEGDEAGWRAGVGGGDFGAGDTSDSSTPGRGGLAGEASGSALLQAEKGGSGLEIGGNSDSGGPDDTRPDGDVPAGSAGWPKGSKGGRAGIRKPHASQNWLAMVAPQRGQVSPSPATSRPDAWCFPVLPSRSGKLLILVPQTSQKSLFAEWWPCGHTVLILTPSNR
jgi:hypothetical protein